MQYGISVIVPTYNEEKYIGMAIDSILGELKNAHIPYEIIVVDNLSSDSTASIVSTYPVTHLTCNKKGSPSATRNLGAEKAQYEILCFVDGDCLVTPNWFQQVITALKDPSVGAYGGPALSPENGNWIETTWAPTAIKSFVVNKSVLPGANFSLHAKLFKQLNGFDMNLTTAEDDDLSNRIMHLGLNVVSDSAHPVIHLGYPKSLLEIFKKQIWHGSSQLKAHGLFGDKMVVLTSMWLVAIFAMLFLGIISTTIFYITLLFVLACPMIIAKKRTKNFKYVKNSTLFKSYIISWFFLAGRSVGLIAEIVKRVKP